MQREGEHRHYNDDEDRRPFHPAYLEGELVEARDAYEHVVGIRQRRAVHRDGEHGDDRDEGIAHSRAHGESGEFAPAFHFRKGEGDEVAEPHPEGESAGEKVLGGHGGKGKIAPEVQVGLKQSEIGKDEEEEHGREELGAPRHGAQSFHPEIEDGEREHDDDDIRRHRLKEVHHQEDYGVAEIDDAFQDEPQRRRRGKYAEGQITLFGEEAGSAAPRKGEHGGKREGVHRQHEEVEPKGAREHPLRDEPGEGRDFEDDAAAKDERRGLGVVERGLPRGGACRTAHRAVGGGECFGRNRG